MKLSITCLCLLIPFFTIAQQTPLLYSRTDQDARIDQLLNNEKISADSAFRSITRWNTYRQINKTGTDYLFYYNDPQYGRMPVRVYVPASYKNTVKNPCVLMLHGAVGQTRFSYADSTGLIDDNLLFDPLKNTNYILIRPVADKTQKFSWVDQPRGMTGNPAFSTLANIVTALKKILNIDDDRVFALGHSDGADGVIGMGVFKHDQFAGIIAYNSMLTNLFSREFYIRNLINTPAYIVHSDKDDLREMLQTRMIVDSLKKLTRNIIYKEYIGYEHWDKHLSIDMPNTVKLMNNTTRQPFKGTVTWEASQASAYNVCNWLRIVEADTSADKAVWHKPLNFKQYSKKTKQIDETYGPYYHDLQPSAVVKGIYKNNEFTVQTSGVKELEILINPVMVNVNKPVAVTVNGKRRFLGKATLNKAYMLNSFRANFDRQQVWVSSIKIKVIKN